MQVEAIKPFKRRGQPVALGTVLDVPDNLLPKMQGLVIPVEGKRFSHLQKYDDPDLENRRIEFKCFIANLKHYLGVDFSAEKVETLWQDLQRSSPIELFRVWKRLKIRGEKPSVGDVKNLFR